MEISVQPAESKAIDEIINLSIRVQERLTASGSLQIIGPLQRTTVETAIAENRCFVGLSNSTSKIIGCALIKPILDITSIYALDEATTTMLTRDSPRPWWCLHSVMLDPDVEGRGIGRELVDGVGEWMMRLQPGGGHSVFLDCWAGNTKLRAFYERVGFVLVRIVPEEDYWVAVFCKSAAG